MIFVPTHELNLFQLCIDCGHAWRAALLEGWRLHHDPNIESIFQKRISGQSEGEDVDIASGTDEGVTGNPNRDLWKTMALRYCEKVTTISINIFPVCAFF